MDNRIDNYDSTRASPQTTPRVEAQASPRVEPQTASRMSRSLPNRPAGRHATSSRSTWVGVVACWVALVATIACNGLFEYFRLGGVTSSEVSNQVFAWFTPAGYVFSIWGVIYAALAVWMIAETRRAMHGAALSRRQASLFVLSCALNVGWLVAFHYQQIAIALVVLMALWLDLALLYLEFRDDETRSKLNLAPFSLYHAWTTVAVIANATNLATRMIPASTMANQVSTVALAAAVLVVAGIAMRNSRDYVFPLVILWATIGVGVRLMAVDAMVSAIVLALSGIGAVAIYVPALVMANRESPRSGRLQVGED